MAEPSPEHEPGGEEDGSGMGMAEDMDSSMPLSALLTQGGRPAAARRGSWPGAGHGAPRPAARVGTQRAAAHPPPGGVTLPGAATGGATWPGTATGAPTSGGAGWHGMPFPWTGCYGGSLPGAAARPPVWTAGSWPGTATSATPEGTGFPRSSHGAPPAGVGWSSSAYGASSADDSLGWEGFNATATAIFGPNWREMTLEGVEDDGVQILGSTAASRGGRGGRGGRGARSRKPPAVPVAPPSDTVDLTDSSEADWCDENVRVVCEIFADEVQKGNRATTHLSKTGFKNVIQRFQERTSILYTKKQFKNKWDKLKGDYAIWKKLVNHQTGIGWDESRKNIVMP